MVNKNQCYERSQTHYSRFRALVQSDSPTDRATAEAYRLGSQEWLSVAVAIGAYNTSFDVQIHLNNIRSRWDRYIATGVAHDSLDTLARDQLRKFVEDDRAMRIRAAKERGADAKTIENLKPPKAGAVADARPDDPRNFVDPMAIEGVLNDFREAFDLPLVEFNMGKP